MNWLNFAVGFATGILSGFGIGGGSLLILYLTGAAGVPSYRAGGINLLYFLFCAPAALVAHWRGGRIEKSTVLLCAGTGAVTSVLTALLAGGMESDWLRRLFGILLLYIGLRELFCPRSESKPSGPPKASPKE